MMKEVLLNLILWVLLGPLYLLVVPAYFLLYCYHVFVTKVIVIGFSANQVPRSPVSGIDFSFSTDNYWTSPMGGIAFVYKVKGYLSPDLLKERLEFQLNHSKSNGNYNRLKSFYPQHWAGYPFWTHTTKDSFKIENHIRIIGTEEGESVNSINNHILTWLNSNFLQFSPLWDVLILPKSCIFGFRIHHIIGDGISMQQFIQGLLDVDNDNGKLIKGKQIQVQTSNSREKCTLQTLNKYFWIPLTLTQFTKEYFFHQDYFTAPKIKRGLNLSYTTISLIDLKLVRSHLSSKLQGTESESRCKSVNFTTVLLFILSSSIRKFLTEDIKIDQRSLPNHINIVVPLPIPNRTHPVDTFCNFWTHGIFKVPIAEPNKYMRLHKLYKESQTLEQTKSNETLSAFTKLYDVLPKCLFSRLTKINMGTSIGLTNLNGGQRAELICGCEIIKKYAILGLQWKEASLTIGSLSYKDKLTITILSNQSTVPSETLNQTVLQYFQNEVRDLIHEFDLGQLV